MQRRKKLQKADQYMHCAVVALALFSLGCNPREDGCLDLNAANFEFTADRHNQDLCRYPNLTLNVLYAWADSSLQLNRLYENAHGQIYAIHDVQLLWSGFIIRDDEGEEHTVLEQVRIFTESGELEVPDDFVILERTQLNISPGTFRYAGPVSNLRFVLGIPEEYTPMDAGLLPTGHILRSQRAGYDVHAGAFATARLIIARDSIASPRDTFWIYRPPEIVHFTMADTFSRGVQNTIPVAIDFRAILDPVDLTGDPAEITADAGSRIREAIRLR